ncbi:unnamed protein product [Rhizophagus irregularis]|nr:unnamed protein product [Rhizophagus irregularis]
MEFPIIPLILETEPTPPRTKAIEGYGPKSRRLLQTIFTNYEAFFYIYWNETVKLPLSSDKISKESLDKLKEVRKQRNESRRSLQEMHPQLFGPDIASNLFKQMLC